MIERRLDELGWHQFEDFIQTLLKAALGMGVEAWGGRGDFGRDCYCPSPLKFPSQQMNPGPFLFQAKFVGGANATAADYFPALKSAVRAEMERVRARRESLAWQNPNHYVLVTNCPLSGSQRIDLDALLREVMPKTETHLVGAKDISGMAADHPNVRRYFPQILGLGDLEQLIRNATNKELLERSKAALESAELLAPVFVPTRAYDRAWQVLGQHSFAVLEGPPEMGKTAIASTIGALKHFDGWEVYECRTPGDVFEAFSEERQQFFIADDAFGRTEYDPSLGRKWERDLDKLLRRVDKRHWLVWTSRKHILERAIHSLDLQGVARNFPTPSAVLVDATALSLSEKTLILYRHARNANLSDSLKAMIQGNGRLIVKHPHFTPERIRRFVTKALPDLAAGAASPLTAGSLSLAISNEIANPTDSMRKSFIALSTKHKAFLYALIETHGDEDALMKSYQRLEGSSFVEGEVREIADELSHSFIRVSKRLWGNARYYQWMHPSVRDLVIDQLSTDPDVRKSFLHGGSIGMVKLALSEEGGHAGKRLRPLLRDRNDWKELSDSCGQLIRQGDAWLPQQVLEALLSVEPASLKSEQDSYQQLVKAACEAIRERWDRAPKVATTELFETTAQLSQRVRPLPQLPDPESLWKEALGEAEDAVLDEFDIEPVESLSNFLRLVQVLTAFEPRFLAYSGFPDDQEELIDELEKKMARSVPSPSGNLDKAADIASGALDAFDKARSVPAFAGLIENLENVYAAAVEDIQEAKTNDEPNENYDSDRTPTDQFSDNMIDAVLCDI